MAASVTADSFEAGLRFERERFMYLTTTPESKALRHAFFAERAAGKVPGVPPDTQPRPIASAAVVGAGTMGAGIAMNFANAGIPVTILEMKQEALDKGLAGIRTVYERSVAKGKLTADKLAQRMALVTGTLSYDALAQADIVVEAVFEDMGVKELVFRELDKLMKPGAILATNTSSLDVNRIAAFTGRPQDVIGLHFFSPAHVMKLLEIVRGAQTAPDVLLTALALAKKLRKTGVVSGVCDGFIGNRMLEQYLRQAYFLLEEGALPEQVDRAIEAFGFAMGPFRMSDLAGNDIGWHIRKRRAIECTWLCLFEAAGPPVRARPLRAKDGRRLVRLPGGRPCGHALTAPSTRWWSSIRTRSVLRAAPSLTPKSSNGSCTHWSTRARRSSKKASRCGRRISIWCT